MCITIYRDDPHWVKLANCGILWIWVGFSKGHLVHTHCIKKCLTRVVTFFNKLYGNWSKVDRPVVAPTSYNDYDDDTDVDDDCNGDNSHDDDDGNDDDDNHDKHNNHEDNDDDV